MPSPVEGRSFRHGVSLAREIGHADGEAYAECYLGDLDLQLSDRQPEAEHGGVGLQTGLAQILSSVTCPASA
jgi:hypothetical protein